MKKLDISIIKLDFLHLSKPLFLLLLWIGFVGVVLSCYVQRSVQPPVFDAMAYYVKAYNFWNAVDNGSFFNPLNIEPSFRPFGTVLMSYPFGFEFDYHGFYFRSVFFPIVLVCLAMLISGYRNKLSERNRWDLTVMVMFFTSFPLFFNFDYTGETPTFWGLVDNFFAGIAAISMASIVRSVWQRSLFWLIVAIIVSAFSLIVKPAGAIIMLLVGGAWLGLMLHALRVDRFVIDRRDQLKSLFRFGIIAFSLFYSAVLLFSFNSNYLVLGNLSYGTGAVKILQRQFQIDWLHAFELVHYSFGYPFLVWGLFVIVLACYYTQKRIKTFLLWNAGLIKGLMVSTCVILVFGLFYWMFITSYTQIRYLFPIWFMGLVCAAPWLLVKMEAASKAVRAVFYIIMLLPVLNISLLLMQDTPSKEWEKITGVVLNSGANSEVADQAISFSNALRQRGGLSTIYMFQGFSGTPIFGIVSSHVQYSRLKNSGFSAKFINPIDWVRPPAFRINEMLDSDYWVFQPLSVEIPNKLVNDFNSEVFAFRWWATGLGISDGVDIITDSSDLRIIKIVDIEKLEKSFTTFVSNYHWSSNLALQNLSPSGISERKVQAGIQGKVIHLESIKFGSEIFLRALSSHRAGDKITVQIWWRPLIQIRDKKWFLFIHGLNASGDSIIENNQIPLVFKRMPSNLKENYLFNELTFKQTSNLVAKVGIGVYDPNGEILSANKGERDYNGKRVIIPNF